MAAATWARRVAVRSFVPVVAVVGVGMAAADRFETCERTTCASKEEVMASLGIKAADTDQSTCPPDREELGRGTWALVRLDRIALGPMAQSALAAEPRRLLLHACFAASFDGSVLPRPAPGRGRDLNAKLYPRPRALLPLLPLRRGAPLRLGAAATDVSRCHTARCRTVGAPLGQRRAP